MGVSDHVRHLFILLRASTASTTTLRPSLASPRHRGDVNPVTAPRTRPPIG